jgi:nucleotide-binding universal stress UspA family protein
MASAFSRILCPVDLNDVSSQALELALMLARQHQGSVRLLYVSALRMPDLSQSAAHPASEVTARLEQLGRDWFGGKVPYEVDLWTGDIVTAILKAIRESEADLVVMATHGREGMDRLVLGSVTEQVVRGSPKPVLTVKPTQPSGHRG